MLLGGVLLAVGLVLGFVPVSAAGASCGSGFVGSSAPLSAEFAAALGGRSSDAGAACDAARSPFRVVAWALVVPGALLLAGLVLGGTGKRTETPAERLERARSQGLQG